MFFYLMLNWSQKNKYICLSSKKLFGKASHKHPVHLFCVKLIEISLDFINFQNELYIFQQRIIGRNTNGIINILSLYKPKLKIFFSSKSKTFQITMKIIFIEKILITHVHLLDAGSLKNKYICPSSKKLHSKFSCETP